MGDGGGIITRSRMVFIYLVADRSKPFGVMPRAILVVKLAMKHWTPLRYLATSGKWFCKILVPFFVNWVGVVIVIPQNSAISDFTSFFASHC